MGNEMADVVAGMSRAASAARAAHDAMVVLNDRLFPAAFRREAERLVSEGENQDAALRQVWASYSPQVKAVMRRAGIEAPEPPASPGSSRWPAQQ